jgi:triphosphoribosyl-dephospho-CoA synthase
MTIGNLAARAAEMAVRALLREAEAGPKPGLVDRFGPGVHTDMDISHFRLSAVALRPYFEAIILEAALPTDALAETLRTLGLQAEAAMLAATGGVNTHKGAIWTIGLLSAAIGSLMGYGYSAFCAEEVCAQAARIAQAILSPTKDPGSAASPNAPSVGVTKGLAARHVYGLRSARDEALEGFPSIQSRALPLARKLRDATLTEDNTVISVLLAVMGVADDTCLAARGGLPALELAKSAARQVLESGGPFSAAGGILYRKMVADFRKDGLSPGGSADLCAATLFLADIEVWIARCQPDEGQTDDFQQMALAAK